MDIENYECYSCKWQGGKEMLHCDSVETCMGVDIIEICPQCGSFEVYPCGNI